MRKLKMQSKSENTHTQEQSMKQETKDKKKNMFFNETYGSPLEDSTGRLSCELM